jgi:hypothetical protein
MVATNVHGDSSASANRSSLRSSASLSPVDPRLHSRAGGRLRIWPRLYPRGASDHELTSPLATRSARHCGRLRLSTYRADRPRHWFGALAEPNTRLVRGRLRVRQIRAPARVCGRTSHGASDADRPQILPASFARSRSRAHHRRRARSPSGEPYECAAAYRQNRLGYLDMGGRRVKPARAHGDLGRWITCWSSAVACSPRSRRGHLRRLRATPSFHPGHAARPHRHHR